MLRPARPCDDRRWEANRVAAVVDPCRSGLDRVEAGGKQWDQRLHEVPVRDGRTVGSRRRALGIDVDPLVVTGSVSERVNPVLVDCQPIAGTQGLTNRRANLVHARTQVLAVLRGWKADPLDERINPNGSGISLGHPVGATGARILAAAAHEAKRRDARHVLERRCASAAARAWRRSSRPSGERGAGRRRHHRPRGRPGRRPLQLPRVHITRCETPRSARLRSASGSFATTPAETAASPSSPAPTASTTTPTTRRPARPAGIGRAHLVGLSLGGMTACGSGPATPSGSTGSPSSAPAPSGRPASAWTDRAATVRAGGSAAIAKAVVERWFTSEFLAAHPDVRAAHEAMVAAISAFAEPEPSIGDVPALGSTPTAYSSNPGWLPPPLTDALARGIAPQAEKFRPAPNRAFTFVGRMRPFP